MGAGKPWLPPSAHKGLQAQPLAQRTPFQSWTHMTRGRRNSESKTNTLDHPSTSALGFLTGSNPPPLPTQDEKRLQLLILDKSLLSTDHPRLRKDNASS